MTLYETLQERGFIAQCTDEKALSALLSKETVIGYIGYDPTASSLHVGHLLPIITLMHLQKAGHRPFALVGGGTGLIGDPSGRSEMRNFLTLESLAENVQALRTQLEQFLEFGQEKAVMVNNADWLLPLKYIEFLRDVGVHFSVNRMLAADSVKARLERGMNFIEFNYSLLQAYDFMYLAKNYNCKLQLGGSDQWGNIVAGIDLTRRMLGKEVYGLTLPLLVTASGHKMGKSANGTVWLNAEKTSVYDFYQFWVNTDDNDVIRFLKLFTFLPMNQINELAKLTGADLRQAKQVLALEVTGIVHGQKQAASVQQAAQAAFAGKGDSESVPSTNMSKELLAAGVAAFKLLVDTGLAASSSEARRLIAQGGAYLGEDKITAFDQIINLENLAVDGTIWLRAGKKKHHRIIPY